MLKGPGVLLSVGKFEDVTGEILKEEKRSLGQRSIPLGTKS
jgi:hypothetical protein